MIPHPSFVSIAGVPVFYGLVQVSLIFCYLLIAWKLGWTYAPPSQNFLRVVSNSYQPHGDGEMTRDRSFRSEANQLRDENVQLQIEYKSGVLPAFTGSPGSSSETEFKSSK